MTQRVFIPGPLPGLNELIAAAKHRASTVGRKGRRWNAYAALKVQWGETVVTAIRQAHIAPARTPVFLSFTWREATRRRDLDNVAAGGRKIINDSLVTAGVLGNDSWAHVVGWTDHFVVDRRRPGVEVEIQEQEAPFSDRRWRDRQRVPDVREL
ncbi:MAG TPA: hypothetical protein VKK81_25665 [Candidatus Binatia bacterium]|nr:hypothetical protein [Candidatus Binatia bacterium]